jgi:polyphosphate kinase
MSKIEREIGHARAGKPARIIAKMNALNEVSVVEILYQASIAGVQIDLIVRGVHAQARRARHLRQYPRALDRRPLSRAQPRLLVRERRRTRNLLFQRRLDGTQHAAPLSKRHGATSVAEFRTRGYLPEALANYLADNTQAWNLLPDGHYERVTPGDDRPHCAQYALIDEICS